jgi:hypothetical protein
LKFGVVVVVAQVIHAVTVVRSPLVAQAAISLLKQLILTQGVNIVYALVVHGRVVSHILVVQVWDVNHILMDTI